jgi:ABC-type transport system involved in multi-copper enzyme maturation permease subunit
MERRQISMTFLPIVERELRQQARQPRTYWVRFAAVLLGVMIALGLLSPSFYGVIGPDQTGRALFLALGGLAFAYTLLAGVFATADCISEEKRDGTLGLLFLTDLSGHDVVLGKLVGRALNPAYGLVAVLPVMALALLFGGVLPGEFWRAALALLNTLFLSVAVGLWVSARSVDGRLAMAGTLLVLAALVAGPWVFVGMGVLTAALPASPLLLASPLLPALLVDDALFAANPGKFTSALVVQHLFGWLALVWASARVRGSWQRLGVENGVSAWQRLMRLRGRRPPTTWPERARCLELNPVLWLGRREQGLLGSLPLLLALTTAALLMGWVTLRSPAQSSLLVALTGWLLHAVVKVWLAAEACRLLHDARRTGALELLLVSPLRQLDIVEGLLASVKLRFLWPVLLVVLVDILMLMLASSAAASTMGGVGLSLMFFVMVGIFLADAYTLTWVGLWRGMAASTLTRAFLGTVVRVLFVPWGMFLALSAGAMLLTHGEPPSPGLLLALWFAASYITDGVLCAVGISVVTSDFRDMAARAQSAGLWRELWRFFHTEPPGPASK